MRLEILKSAPSLTQRIIEYTLIDIGTVGLRPLVDVSSKTSVFWLFFQANLILINHPHRPSSAKSECEI